jgi:hypothetical protein
MAVRKKLFLSFSRYSVFNDRFLNECATPTIVYIVDVLSGRAEVAY